MGIFSDFADVFFELAGDHISEQVFENFLFGRGFYQSLIQMNIL